MSFESSRLPLRSFNNYYQTAKKFEYDSRNLDKAIEFYLLAIKNKEKVDSAIKDLAAVLHQAGRTKEAVEFLESYRGLYKGDMFKYDNLIQNLKKQINAPSGKNLNRSLLFLGAGLTVDKVYSLFRNSSRIVDVSFYKDLSFGERIPATEAECYCLISFVSYSAAKKTLDTLKSPEASEFEKYWVNVNRLIVCEADLEDK